jgi:hypothetical protein
MIIKLLPTQIPEFWELIKYAIAKVYELEDKDYQSNFNSILFKLLNDKAQCWIRVTEGRKLIALMITEIQVDRISGDKYLVPDVLYSWRVSDDNQWIGDFEFIKEFAVKEGCKRIIVESKNPRMWQIFNLLDFKDSFRRFTLEVL